MRALIAVKKSTLISKVQKYTANLYPMKTTDWELWGLCREKGCKNHKETLSML